MARKRIVNLALVFAVSGLLLGGLLVHSVWTDFGPIPAPAGEAYGRAVSPDGQWVVQSYLDELSSGWATVEPASGGLRRTIYYGEPANASWRGGHVVVTEQESRAEHLLDARSGTWDQRVDAGLWSYGSMALQAVPIVLVVLFDVWWLRRWMRRSAGQPASTGPHIQAYSTGE